jgi:hypothetical protein
MTTAFDLGRIDCLAFFFLFRSYPLTIYDLFCNRCCIRELRADDEMILWYLMEQVETAAKQQDDQIRGA